MPLEGVEPPLTCVNMDLNHARLPIPPQRLELVIVAAQPAPSQAADNCPSFVDRCKNHGRRTTNETKKPPRPNCSSAAAVENSVNEAGYCVATSRPPRVTCWIYAVASIVSLIPSVCPSP